MEQSFFIEIEGVEDRFSFGPTPDEDFVGGRRFDQDIFVQPPDSISDSVDPITGDIDLSSYTFTLSARRGRDGAIPIVETLLYQQSRPVGFLTQDFDTGGEAIFLDPARSSADVSSGDPLYVGLETLRVTTVVTEGESYLVARGQYGSAESDHLVGAPVFDGVPRWRGRKVWLYSYDSSKSEPVTLRWQGYLDEIQRPSNGTTIRISCRNLWIAARETTANREPPRGTDTTIGQTAIDGEPGRPRVRANILFDERLAGDASDLGYIQIGEMMLPATLEAETGAGEFRYSVESQPLLGSSTDGEDGRLEVHPLFVQSRLADEESLGEPAREVDGAEGSVETPSVLDDTASAFPDHPLSLAMLLLTDAVIRPDGSIERDTGIAGSFSASLGDLLGDGFEESARSLIEQTREIRIDHFILGQNGDDFDVMEVVIETLLRPYGFFIGTDETGAPTILEFSAVTTVEAEEVEQESRVVRALLSPWVGEVDIGLQRSVDTIDATIGELPWRDGDRLLVEAFNAGSGRSRLGDGAKWSLDYSTISRDRGEDVRQKAIRRSVLSAYGFPSIRCRVPDADDLSVYALGQVVRIGTLPVEGGYLIDSTGEQVEDLSGLEDFFGIVTARRWDPARSIYELTILLTSYGVDFLRLRAPSGVIVGVTEVDGSWALELQSPSPFSSPDGDVESFLEFGTGYSGGIYTPSLELVQEVVIDQELGGELIVGAETEPEVGQIVRLLEPPGPTTDLTDLKIYNFFDDDGAYA